jgi:coniferyl-aldehyde dehydrogenase
VATFRTKTMNPSSAVTAFPLLECLARQRQAFLREGVPSLKQRRADLAMLKCAIIARKADFEAAVKTDFGHRSTHETAVMELMTVTQGINYLSRNLRRWMRPTRRHVAMPFQPARSYIIYQPLGVIGIMAPWNYPLSLALMPLATALAAGDRAMIKPSEVTPATSALLEAMLAELFTPEQVAVVQGDAAVGAEFAALPFDHLIFTGSTPVGRAVMKAAADNLVPVTLELGGKSPVIVERGHGATSAAGIAYGKLANAGQTCVAPDYVLLHENDVKSFLGAFDATVKRLYPNGPTSDDYTSIVNDRHYQRLVGAARRCPRQGRADPRNGPPPAGCGHSCPHAGAHCRARRHRRYADHAGGDLRPATTGAYLRQCGPGNRLHQCPTASTRALLLRPNRKQSRQAPEPDNLR